MDDVAVKLICLYAFCPGRQHNVVPIWNADIDSGMTLTNFRLSMVKHHEVEIGPRGGERKINPVDVWLNSKNHIEVAGIRLRPDMPRPIYEEGGELFVNSYRPPVHATGGDTVVFWEFMQHLLPIALERQWFTEWLAHKAQRPEVPGPAVVMVARRQGSGRGTLFEILRALFGQRYVRTLAFREIMGKTYQSQYNEWQASSLIATVNESHDSDDGFTYRGRKAAYEHLKELVDPRGTERQISIKREANFFAMVFASIIIATNNADGLPVEQGDRRMGVLSNGDPLPMKHPIHAWMRDPRNIGALFDELVAMELVSYDPYAPPPDTIGKDAMIDENETDLDELFAFVMENLKGELYTPVQIVHRVGGLIDAHHDVPQQWKSIVKKMARHAGFRLCGKDGPGWVVRLDGRKWALYATSKQAAMKWANLEMRHQELLKNGHPDPRQRLKEV